MTGHQLAAILRLAADEYLWNGVDDMFEAPGPNGYSCDAYHYAAGWKFTSEERKAGYDFLSALGVDPDDTEQFTEVPHGETRQGARFLWLDFAALVAEEEVGDMEVSTWVGELAP